MKFTVRKLAILSLAFNLALLLFFLGKRLYFSHPVADKTPTPGEVWNQAKLATYKDMPVDSQDVVFIGNSLTEFFPLNEMFKGAHIKNRGIVYNQSFQLLERVQGIISGHPRKIFIEIGINDLGYGVTIDSLFKNYKILLTMIQEGSPATRIYAQSVFPVNKSGRYAAAEGAIDLFNPILRDYCRSIGVTYVDIYPALYKNGGLDSGLTWDGVHLNMKGYAIWKGKINDLVN